MRQDYEPAFPIVDLHEHPDNPRRGDENAIDASMATHGFYGAVLAQRSTRRIIAGNHRTRVARQQGAVTVPVLFLDVDDDQARRILLVDNRTNDVAGYDDRELAALLTDLEDLGGTGFDDDDLTRLLAGLEEVAPDPSAPIVGDERYTPSWIFDGLGLHFDLDVAAPVDPTAASRVPASRYLTVHDDGLTAPWDGLVWMNPPYSVAAAWARRWIAHPDGVCLICTSNSSWVPEMFERADLFVFLYGPRFETPFDQSEAISSLLLMAAQGRGTVGLERLAGLQNWPTFGTRTVRPRPDMPMQFRSPVYAAGDGPLQ